MARPDGFTPYYFTGKWTIVQAPDPHRYDVWLSIAAFATVPAAREWARRFSGAFEYRLIGVEVPEASDDLIEHVHVVQ